MPSSEIISFNGKIGPASEAAIPPLNRAQSLGDGLFETIFWTGKKCLFLKDHLQRLDQGVKTLGLKREQDLLQKLKEQIHALIAERSLLSFSRIRLTLFRAGGGAYYPPSDEFHTLIQYAPLESDPWIHEAPLTATLVNRIPLQYTAVSGIKSISALPYVYASSEARRRGAEEPVLVDQNGNLAEFGSGNLFVIRGEELLTPHPFTGCLPGIMRRSIIREARRMGYKIKLVYLHPDELLPSDTVFFCNVIRGLRPLALLNTNRIFETKHPILDKLKEKQLQLRGK